MVCAQPKTLQQVIKSSQNILAPSPEHQWYQWCEMSTQSLKILKHNTHPATVASPCCHLTTHTEVSAAIPPDYRTALFHRLDLWDRCQQCGGRRPCTQRQADGETWDREEGKHKGDNRREVPGPRQTTAEWQHLYNVLYLYYLSLSSSQWDMEDIVYATNYTVLFTSFSVDFRSLVSCYVPISFTFINQLDLDWTV